MSGHSKWSTIKHKKAAQDAKRGKVFGEVGRMIRVAVKEGGSGDPEQNPALRVALDKARAVNMPKDNIERAIERGLGRSASGAILEEVTYEGYGPGGVGILAMAVTDNRNRTGSEVRGLFERHGGSLGGPGSSSYLFDVGAGGTSVTVKIPMPILETETIHQLDRLLTALEELDEVEVVYSNRVSS